MLLKPITNYDRYTDAKLSDFTGNCISAITGSSSFPTPDPSIATMTTALNEFDAACTAAANRDTQKIQEREAKREALINLMYLLQAYIAYAAKGDIVVAESSFFKFLKGRKPSVPLSAPANLMVTNSTQTGTMYVSVDAVQGARAYIHQYTTDPTLKEESWVSMTCTKSKCTIDGLTPGTVYYWRVAAVGSKDQIMYSSVTSRMAV